ncbi:MAG: DUF3887 domain-containing protein [Lachnospiraceae bacterium]|nr:DUF3887 domain-containing protein [Butyrivibrio sp.]MCM1344768.1 DUF3887 domain-containing protein [Muribaculaceae bacterium]MCM1411706.1 DUF3887 domain-containing protein [Lachnospiraceae bacterium]
MNAEKYAKQVTKHLRCSGGRKREIRKQITSDIRAALEEGGSLEQVVQDMGEPKALAAEFNVSFSETEKKAAGRAKVWKVLTVVLIILAVLISLAWWALPKTRLLSDSKVFSEEQVRERAELIIDLFNEEDHVGLRPYLTDEMAELMTEETLGQIKLYIGDDWGEMLNIGNVYLLEVSRFGQKGAMVQMTVSYEKVGVTYTINLDENLQLAGFYLK